MRAWTYKDGWRMWALGVAAGFLLGTFVAQMLKSEPELPCTQVPFEAHERQASDCYYEPAGHARNLGPVSRRNIQQ